MIDLDDVIKFFKALLAVCLAISVLGGLGFLFAPRDTETTVMYVLSLGASLGLSALLALAIIIFGRINRARKRRRGIE